jgi:hypothetical protein
MARRFSTAALAVLTAGALTVGIAGSATGPSVASASQARPTAAQANATTGSALPVSVPATLNGVSGTLSGTVPKFSHNTGSVLANLSFTRFTSKSGNVTRLRQGITRSLPVTNAATRHVCKILNLTLGPLHLNLLGLVVNLNRVHLRIFAVRGPGNLLGNLLCAVAHLLDSPAPVTKKAALLNDVTGTLGILGRL